MPASTAAPAPARASGATARRVPLQRCDAFIDVRDAQRLMPGAFVDGAAAVNAQTTSAAGAQQPSLTAALVNLVAYIFAPPTKRKRDDESDDIEACNPKRRRVMSNALPPSRAVGRPVAGRRPPAIPTGATASSHSDLTVAAASSAARNAPKTLAKPVSTGKGPTVRQISSMPKPRVSRAMPGSTPTLIDLNFGNDALQAPSIGSAQSGSASVVTSGAGKASTSSPGSVPTPTVARPVPSTPRRVFTAVASAPPETPKPKRVRDVGKRKVWPSAGAKGEEKNNGDASPA